MQTCFELDGVKCVAEGPPSALVAYMLELGRREVQPQKVRCVSFTANELRELKAIDAGQPVVNAPANEVVKLTRYVPKRQSTGLPLPTMKFTANAPNGGA